MKRVTIDQIKKIREETGAPVAEIKKVLEEAGGDEKKAKGLLTQKGLERAAKKAQRPVNAGVVDTYIHHTLNSGATVVLQSETDFVARNSEFQQLAHDIAAHGTATNPLGIEELLSQPWIRDEGKTIQDLINEKIAKFGENIKIKDFKRFEV